MNYPKLTIISLRIFDLHFQCDILFAANITTAMFLDRLNNLADQSVIIIEKNQLKMICYYW